MTSDPTDPTEAPAVPPASTSSPASRRSFLIRSGAAAGATAIGAAVLVSGPAEASTRRPAESDAVPSGGSVVAYVSDVAKGEITVMSGEHEVLVSDPQLARAIARKVR